MYGESVQRCLPIPDGHSPFFADISQRQPEDFENGLIVGESPLGFGHLAQAHVQRFYGIRRIDHLPDFRRVVKEGDYPLPVGPPGFCDERITGIVFVFQALKG